MTPFDRLCLGLLAAARAFAKAAAADPETPAEARAAVQAFLAETDAPAEPRQ